MSDLAPDVRARAQQILARLCEKWRSANDLPPWRYAILVGRARVLAQTTPEQFARWSLRLRATCNGKKTRDHSKLPYAWACRRKIKELGRSLTPAERAVIWTQLFPGEKGNTKS